MNFDKIIKFYLEGASKMTSRKNKDDSKLPLKEPKQDNSKLHLKERKQLAKEDSSQRPYIGTFKQAWRPRVQNASEEYVPQTGTVEVIHNDYYQSRYTMIAKLALGEKLMKELHVPHNASSNDIYKIITEAFKSNGEFRRLYSEDYRIRLFRSAKDEIIKRFEFRIKDPKWGVTYNYRTYR